MLIRSKDLEAIFAGRVTAAFRRWKRPTVKAGGTLRTPMGLLAIDAVEEVDPAVLGEADALEAGLSLEELRQMLAGREGVCTRIRLRPGGPDPRTALRGKTKMSEAEVAALGARLARLDGAVGGPWTAAVLAMIAQRPGVAARELAALLGMERDDFKVRVRKLKALGLTISLDRGYRLSPRGTAFLARGSRAAAAAKD
tara:strand:- start:5312 stop:5905 length:594 start_codon:yes stop_codon:yes gene_type:complete